MASEVLSSAGIDRQTYHPTRHRGFSFRYLADGSKKFHGYVAGLGRRPLKAAGEREALAEWRDLCGKVAKGEKIAPANVRFAAVAEQWFESKHRVRPWTRKGYRGRTR